MNEIVASAAEATGEIIGEMLMGGEMSFKKFGKMILMMALDVTEKIILLAIAETTAKQIASKGFLGIPTAIILTALIKGAFAGIKAQVQSFAVGTEFLDGNKNGSTGGILIEGHKGERILTSEQNKKLLGISNEDVPSLVHAGLNFYKIESIMRQVRDNSEITNKYLSRNEIHWSDAKMDYMKDIRTGRISRIPKKLK